MTDHIIHLPSISVFCNLVQGGAEKQAVETAKIFHQKGHEVIFYCYNLKKAFYHPEDEIAVCDLKNYKARGPEVIDKIFSIFRLRKLIIKNQPDFLISYTTLLNTLSGMINLLNRNKSKTLHIGSERNSVLRYSKGILWKLLCRFFYRGLAGIYANNSPAIRQLKEIIGFDQNRTFLLPNIIDTDFFCPAVDYNKLLTDKFTILIPARICEQKNQKSLVPVAKELKQRGVNPLFVLAGSPEEKYAAELKVLIGQSHVEECFDWVGQQSNIRQYYWDCDIVFLPSLFEGFSNSVCEAMACGSIVLGNKIESITDLIQDGFNGYITDAEEISQTTQKIIEILSLSEDKNQTIRKQARMTVQNYGKEGYYHHIMQILAQVKA